MRVSERAEQANGFGQHTTPSPVAARLSGSIEITVEEMHES
jgi:hypothetical protein